jgi:protein SCO1/2
MASLLLAMTMNLAFAGADIEESMRVPKEMEGAEIVDKRGAKIDQSLVFTRHDGAKVNLSEYFGSAQKLPAIVTLGYYECPMLCSLVLKALIESVKQQSLVLGLDYRILSFSINPNEKPELSALKRKSHLKALSRDDGAWEFFTGDEKSIAQLASELGFGFKFDPRTGDYAHGAGIFILTPDGVLSRTMTGLIYEPRDTKFALMEATGGKIGTVFDRILLTCFHYVPDKHKYGLYVFGTMRVGAALTVFFLASMLTWYWFSERRRRKYAA